MAGKCKQQQTSDEELAGKKKTGIWKKLRRIGICCTVILLLLVAVGWYLLPRIAEKVMSGMIADADLEQADFQVREIGWNSAVIEKVVLADGVWRLTAQEVKVDYDAFDLLKGRVDMITLKGSVCVVNFPESIAEEVSEDGTPDAAEPQEASEDDVAGAAMMHELPGIVEQIGAIRADDLDLTITRPEQKVKLLVDLALQADGQDKFGLDVKCSDFQLHADVTTEQSKTVMKARLNEVTPDHFLSLLEILIDYDGRILPEGLTLGGAELRAELRCEGEVMMPLTLTGELQRIVYDGGDKPVEMASQSARIQLSQDFGGTGYVILSGGVDSLEFPLDPSADFVLTQKKDSETRWQTRIEWGEENAKVTANLEKVSLSGTYDGKPVDMENLNLQISLVDDVLSAAGSFFNNGTELPLKYNQTLSEPDQKEKDDWKLAGSLQLGPVKHTRPLPLLSAVTDLFDDFSLLGESHTKFTFKVGAYLPFEGVLASQLKDVSVSTSDGMIEASGLNGTFQLHLIPLSSTDPTQEDPSYYTLDFTSKKLHIDSEESLDFDLDHTGETPVHISGKGKLGGESKLEGEVKNLTLHGEHDGKEIDLVDTTATFSMVGDELIAKGSFQLKENTIPFTYHHTYTSLGDDWNLAGVFEIKSADLTNPIDNAGIMVGAMDGLSLTGKLALKMDFTKGGEKDFDGVLTTSVAGGKLTFADDGPVIEGISGGIRLSSMKNKQTAGFQRVTATKMTAFDMVMTNLRLDYHMLPTGDIKLRNIAMRALGGNIWLDPFVLPGDDRDYKFKVRMKRLNLAKLAALFPEFNGKIEGNIDGLLPMVSKNGEFLPQTGGMYLTPGRRAKLRYDAGTKFSGGLDPNGREYQQMKMVEDSLKNLELKVLSIRLFDPRDKDKALVLRLRGQAPSVPGSPPIILNINGFKPDDDTVDFFDLLLKHRDKLNFGL